MKLHKGGAIFKSSKTGKVDQFTVSDIMSAQWMRVAQGHELKITLKNEAQFKFDGLKESVSTVLEAHTHTHVYTNIYIQYHHTLFIFIIH